MKALLLRAGVYFGGDMKLDGEKMWRRYFGDVIFFVFGRHRGVPVLCVGATCYGRKRYVVMETTWKASRFIKGEGLRDTLCRYLKQKEEH